MLSVGWGSPSQVDGDIERISAKAEDNLVVGHRRELKVQTSHRPGERICGIFFCEVGLQTKIFPERPMEDLCEEATRVPCDGRASSKQPGMMVFTRAIFGRTREFSSIADWSLPRFGSASLGELMISDQYTERAPRIHRNCCSRRFPAGCKVQESIKVYPTMLEGLSQMPKSGEGSWCATSSSRRNHLIWASLGASA